MPEYGLLSFGMMMFVCFICLSTATVKIKRTPIGPYEHMIAGHARSQGLILVTNNAKLFRRLNYFITLKN